MLPLLFTDDVIEKCVHEIRSALISPAIVAVFEKVVSVVPHFVFVSLSDGDDGMTALRPRVREDEHNAQGLYAQVVPVRMAGFHFVTEFQLCHFTYVVVDCV